jgi:hypothetical protein
VKTVQACGDAGKLGPAFRRIRYGTRGNVVDAERYRPWQAAGYLGIGVETLLRVYGHHHPDHMKDAVAKMTARPTASASPQKRTERKKTNVVKIQ